MQHTTTHHMSYIESPHTICAISHHAAYSECHHALHTTSYYTMYIVFHHITIPHLTTQHISPHNIHSISQQHTSSPSTHHITVEHTPHLSAMHAPHFTTQSALYVCGMYVVEKFQMYFHDSCPTTELDFALCFLTRR